MFGKKENNTLFKSAIYRSAASVSDDTEVVVDIAARYGSGIGEDDAVELTIFQYYSDAKRNIKSVTKNNRLTLVTTTKLLNKLSSVLSCISEEVLSTAGAKVKPVTDKNTDAVKNAATKNTVDVQTIVKRYNKLMQALRTIANAKREYRACYTLDGRLFVSRYEALVKSIAFSDASRKLDGLVTSFSLDWDDPELESADNVTCDSDLPNATSKLHAKGDI